MKSYEWIAAGAFAYWLYSQISQRFFQMPIEERITLVQIIKEVAKGSPRRTTPPKKATARKK